jgi:glycyl-tRNA synthetase beta chain
MKATLLVELLTEELPPKSLARLGEEFAAKLLEALAQHQLADADSASRCFATPRRLAARIEGIASVAADREIELSGPSVKVGLDAAGKPTPALEGFARKSGVAVESLQRANTPKGEVFIARRTVRGASLDDVLAGAVEESLRKLPIAKMMRWGAGEAQFVRPVHGLVMLHGNRIVSGNVLGLASGNRSRGHRFMGRGEVTFASAEDYETRLREEGDVIADAGVRRELIRAALAAEAKQLGATMADNAALLDEVTALVEHPSVYVGEFDASFLEVPQECLILTMQQNQKYFPLFDGQGRLLPKFLIVSNMRMADPANVVRGNQRVVRPRLEDARFFFRQDRKQRLESRVPQLGKVVYHNRLGTQLERVERVQLLAGRIAESLKADRLLAERAAWLSKADLLTGMVGEFPELQGVMGRYYAHHDSEPAPVADAIEAHYRPRFAGDLLPEGAISTAVALADKLEALAGLFGIGEQPTGDKDPYALRRQALGVIRILIEGSIRLDLPALIQEATTLLGTRLANEAAAAEVFGFVLDRLKGYLRERGYAADEIEATVSVKPSDLSRVIQVLEAKRAVPELADLAAANKRVRNILRKSPGEAGLIERALLTEPAEKALHAVLESVSPRVSESLGAGDYSGVFRHLAGMRPEVDAFFDKVMVNAEDVTLRRNRLSLLAAVDALMNGVLDISQLNPGAGRG